MHATSTDFCSVLGSNTLKNLNLALDISRDTFASLKREATDHGMNLCSRLPSSLKAPHTLCRTYRAKTDNEYDSDSLSCKFGSCATDYWPWKNWKLHKDSSFFFLSVLAWTAVWLDRKQIPQKNLLCSQYFKGFLFLCCCNSIEKIFAAFQQEE